MRLNIGIYNLHMQAMGGGEKLTLTLAEHLSFKHNVWLFCSEQLDVPAFERFFEVDLSRVTVAPLKGIGPLSRAVGRVRGSLAASTSLHHFQQLKKFNLDVFINNSYASGLRCPAKLGIFMCMFPYPTEMNSIDTYSQIVAISDYAADWVEKMWGRRAEVIYPACDDMGPASVKAKMILHVGRFIAEIDEDVRQHKAQPLMLGTFKSLTALHDDGWELHFAGSIGPDKHSADFARTVEQSANGFPVIFHFNAAREEIRDLYRRAAIYWHATGYGFDPDKYPSKHEHFGISTVEAMSAGAVPVVYASGGQKEIVTHGVDGLLFSDLSGLANQTLELAADPNRRLRLGQQAVLSSKRFSKAAFAAKIDQLLTRSITGETNHGRR
jgi:glycosyltransferase involved in cell wall biosynthesis